MEIDKLYTQTHLNTQTCNTETCKSERKLLVIKKRLGNKSFHKIEGLDRWRRIRATSRLQVIRLRSRAWARE